MVGESWGDWHLSFNEIMNFDPEFVLALFYLIISIAIYVIFIWHFYRFIARRDCFKTSISKHPRAVGFMKYFCIFPFVAFIFFIGFSLLMLFITRYEISSVLSTSFALVIAIRITAYYSEDLSKDVAKMLPFALLGVFLVDPTYFDFITLQDKVYSLPSFFTQIVQFILLIIIVEWILRILLTAKHAVLPPKQKPLSEEL